MYVQYVYALDGVAEFLPLLCGIMVCSNYTLDCGHLHFGLWPLALWTVCDCWDSNCSTNGICSMQHELSATDILVFGMCLYPRKVIYSIL